MMNIIFFTHPFFLGSQSMPRYVRMLADGMKERGHKVEVWAPDPYFFRLPLPKGASFTGTFKKWLGYIDQYLVFPFQVRRRMKACPADTLFVFTDQALGPWIPLAAKRFHVIHCHDFLAQRSALGEIPENTISWTGRRYQALIRRGYSKGRHFISVSEKTKEDLHQFLPTAPIRSEVVYNGLNQSFTPHAPAEVREYLSKKLGIELSAGYFLHVGGNQWYKNRCGLIDIYNAWRAQGNLKLPLLMIGAQPSALLAKKHEQSPYKADIHLLSGVNDQMLRQAYAGATVFLYPSLAEGFGWPIAEAMASGCPVITTGEGPMTEVGGGAGFYISPQPNNEFKAIAWTTEAVKVVDEVLNLSAPERQTVLDSGMMNAKRFDPKLSLDRIEGIYQSILQTQIT